MYVDVLSRRGSTVTAVSVFSVLAGRCRRWGALAARISPVVASAITQDSARTGGSLVTPAEYVTTVPCLVSSGPPIGSRPGR